MAAFVLIVVAVLSRILPHAGWFNLTAVGGSLLYFGARRPMRQAAWALVPLMATDYYLTTAVYGFAFHAQEYLISWVWYAAVLILGSVLLRERTSIARVATGALLAPTSFFAVSNYAVWAGSGMYPHSLGGLSACYAAALPFYRNDLIATVIVSGLVFSLEAMVRRSHEANAAHSHSLAA